MTRSRRRRRWFRTWTKLLVAALCLYLFFAYLLLPGVWLHYERESYLASAPKTTESSLGLPGDPLNIALLGTKEELIRAMLLSGWEPADRITLRSSVSIATSILLNRSYPTAPMSNLFLWGRIQDLAFQQTMTKSPRKRHHVRFWVTPFSTRDGRPLWVGAATEDQGIGFNRFTGQLTHHIAPNVDAERETLMADLIAAQQLTQVSQETGVGMNIAARNAQGDWYYTDGELAVGILSPENAPQKHPPRRFGNPAITDWRNQGWMFFRSLLVPTLLPLDATATPAHS